MKNKKLRLLLLFVAIALLFGLAFFLYSKFEGSTGGIIIESAPTETGSGTAKIAEETGAISAPDFTVIDWEGKPVKLSSHAGKPVVINLWATWCAYCKVEMPEFQEVFEEYGEEVSFMMIDLTDEASGETVEAAKKFIKESGFTFPVYFDIYHEVIDTIPVNAVPVTYFLNADGTIAGRIVGKTEKESLLRGIAFLLEEEEEMSQISVA